MHNPRLPRGAGGTIMAAMDERKSPHQPDPAPGLWQAWGRLPILALTVFLLLSNLVTQLMVWGLGGGLMLPLVAGALVGVVLPLEVLRRRGQLQPAADLGLDRPAPATLGLVAVVALAGLAPTSLLAEGSLRLHPVDPRWAALYNEHLPFGPGQTAVAVIAAVFAAPLAEEIIFRAFLQRLAARVWGRVPGLVIAALVFGIVHGEPWYMFGLIGVGLILGIVWEATRSLTACWLAHALHNAVSLGALLAGGGVSVEPAAYGTGDWLLAGASAVVLVVAAAALLRRRAR